MKKITFVISEPMLHEQQSVMYLSAALKQRGHETSLIFNPTDPYNRNKIVDELKAEQPDYIALSFMSGMKEHYISLARHIKEHMDTPIVVGGPAPTYDQRVSQNLGPFDASCTGEGDHAFCEFVENYGVGKLSQNFVQMMDGELKSGGLMDLIWPLDQLPFPDREIQYKKDPFLKSVGVKMFMSGRGCPYMCTYCFNHAFNKMYAGKGRVIRHKSVDYFIEEIAQVQKDYGLESIIFEDDIFILQKEWLAEFAEKYPRKINLPYLCYIRPNLVTKEIARHLKDSNCYSARVAVESGNPEIRNLVLKRGLSDEKIIESCDLLREAGIKIQTINMLGLPTETVDQMYETLWLNQKCKPHHVTANKFMPLPGVDITSFALEQGVLDAEFTSPKTAYSSSTVRYPDDVERFLTPFQRLFPLFVMWPVTVKLAPVLTRLPSRLLAVVDTVYRLYRNSHFYPRTRVTLRNKLQALRRYFSYVEDPPEKDGSEYASGWRASGVSGATQ